MAATLAEMTKSELEEMIEFILEKKLIELLGDPDEGVLIKKRILDRLMRQKRAVTAGERGESLDTVVRKLGLE